jgi:hypothetical protein
MAAAVALPPTDTLAGQAIAEVADKLGASVESVARTIHLYMEALSSVRRRAEREERRRIVAVAREEEARRKREAKGMVGPTAERSARGDLEEIQVIGIAGAKAMLSVDPIDRYAKKGGITIRQEAAARRLRNDYQFGIVGARDPDRRTPFMRSGVPPGSTSLSEGQLAAAESYAKAMQAVGIHFSQLVVSVCCLAQDITTLARESDPDNAASKNKSTVSLQQLRWMLKVGLDRLGDHYGDHPKEIYEDTVKFHKGGSVKIQYRCEAPRDTRGRPMERVSAILYNGLPWIAEAKSLGQLREMARKRGDGR